METAKKSSLSFKGFKISKSIININHEKYPSNLEISFDLKGEISRTSNSFRLFVDTQISDKDELININVDTFADFNIDKEGIDEESYKNFIFTNAPAILFPYIRAYITSLTSLSGIKPIQLPLLNLSGLKDSLEKNVVFKD